MKDAIPLDIPNKVDYEPGADWGSIDNQEDIDLSYF